jgi:integrase
LVWRPNGPLRYRLPHPGASLKGNGLRRRERGDVRTVRADGPTAELPSLDAILVDPPDPLRRVFAKHLEAPARSLDRAVVVRVLDGLAKDGKAAMAGAAARYGGALFGWTVKRGTLASNPFERVPVAPTVRRDRVLSDGEIRSVWRATEGPGPFNAIVRALLLTGQRREEVSGLTSSELDPGLSAWTLPGTRSKNSKPHIIPISAQMETLLRAQPCVSGTDLVFPGDRSVFSGWSKSKARLDRRSGVSGWTLHDLRRTAATGMAELGTAPHVIEAVLNHASGHKAGVAGIYNQARYASEMRRALNLWGAHVVAIVEGREAASNVTAFHARNAEPFVGYRLDDEQRRRVSDCTGKDGSRLLSDRFEQLIRDVEESIAHFVLSARGASPRDAHEALRRLWTLIHEGNPSDEALGKLTRALPRRATEYLNRHGLMGIDPEQVDALQCWEADADPETLMTRVLAAEGAQIVEGRSRGHGRRSGRRIEPIIMGRARGTIAQTHKGGRPESAEEQDLVMFLAFDWLRATNKEPTAGRSDKSGFGDLVHSVFQWVGLWDGSATYALRQYWPKVAKGRKAREGQEPVCRVLSPWVASGFRQRRCTRSVIFSRELSRRRSTDEGLKLRRMRRPGRRRPQDLGKIIESGEGPPTVDVSPRRKGVLDVDFEAWLLKRRRLPPGNTAEMWAVPVGATSFDLQCADVAEPPRSKSTPNRGAGPSGRKISSGRARVGAEPPAA